jgi:hypothetical protein
LDIFDSPRFELEPWDDKLFSPAHAHFPPEFGYQANNELIQYGTNGTDVSDFFNSCVNWDEFSSEASISLDLSPTIFKIPENGPCSDSDVEMANMMVSNSSDPFFFGLIILDFCYQNAIC